MRSAGIELTVLDDAVCISLMDRLIREKPDLWAEDIGN
jgi:creatinine deaminase